MAALDSPGTKLHRETGEKKHNTEKQSSNIIQAG